MALFSFSVGCGRLILVGFGGTVFYAQSEGCAETARKGSLAEEYWKKGKIFTQKILVRSLAEIQVNWKVGSLDLSMDVPLESTAHATLLDGPDEYNNNGDGNPLFSRQFARPCCGMDEKTAICK